MSKSKAVLQQGSSRFGGYHISVSKLDESEHGDSFPLYELKIFNLDKNKEIKLRLDESNLQVWHDELGKFLKEQTESELS